MYAGFEYPEKNIIKENSQIGDFEEATKVQSIVQTTCIFLFLRQLRTNTSYYAVDTNGGYTYPVP